MKVHSSITSLVGGTPLLQLARLKSELKLQAEIFAKLEYLNPAGSIKDRVALAMIESAERSGELKAGATVIEPTSGNTGIGLAAVCAAKGYRAVIVMPDNMSAERQKILKAYGAELVLTDASLGMAGAIERAEQLKAEIPHSMVAGQFINPVNVWAHYETTGPEIFADMDGDLDFFVAGVGTGGTVSGAGSYLKQNAGGVKVVAVEPQGSPVLSGGKAGRHNLQGIGAGFVPDLFDRSAVDEIMTVSEEQAYAAARTLAQLEGVLVGISSGAALHAAVMLACRAENKDKKIVVILPDTGDRYLSTELFK